MRSSTSHRGSFDRRLLLLLFAGIAGAPLVWLTTMQTGYVLAYQTCDDRATSWVVVPTLTAIAILAALGVASIGVRRRAAAERQPMPLLGWLAVLMAATMIVVVAASAIGPLVLEPCD
jgi:predicted membrane-bound mannosyltransferase